MPQNARPLNGGKIFAFGDDKTLVVSSKGDGSLVFYPCFQTTENWVRDCGIDFGDKAQVLAWTHEKLTIVQISTLSDLQTEPTPVQN